MVVRSRRNQSRPPVSRETAEEGGAAEHVNARRALGARLRAAATTLPAPGLGGCSGRQRSLSAPRASRSVHGSTRLALPTTAGSSRTSPLAARTTFRIPDIWAALRREQTGGNSPRRTRRNGGPYSNRRARTRTQETGLRHRLPPGRGPVDGSTGAGIRIPGQELDAERPRQGARA